MNSFAEFESGFLAALQQERSDLQDLEGKAEAQLSSWVEHLFRDFLGYIYKEILHEEGVQIGAKGGKQLFPDLRIGILDKVLIFIECKKLGRLSGPKGQEELDDGASQLKAYIRAHLDRAGSKPNTVLGVVTDGNRWLLMGLNRVNEFHRIAEWAFLTDDPRLLAQRLWLLAKPALAQPTPALVEFLARRTLAEVLKGKARWLTNKVNQKLPGGAVSEELVGRWLRDAFPDPAGGLAPADSSPPSDTEAGAPEQEAGQGAGSKRGLGGVALADLITAGILSPPLALFRKYKGRRLEATLLPVGAVEFQGQRYDTCSAAAEAARASITGRTMHTNGWTFWQYQAGDGKHLCLDDARKKLIRSKTGRQEQPDPPDRPERYDVRKRFWGGLLGRPGVKDTRHANLTAGESSWISAGSGVRGLPFVYVIHQEEGRVELYIDRGADQAAANKDIFDRLHAQKSEIESSFGGELSWQRLDDKRACRLAYTVPVGGYKSNESKWPQIQDAMIDAMARLEKALRPHLDRLRTELGL
jgi:hypothetical protein